MTIDRGAAIEALPDGIRAWYDGRCTEMEMINACLDWAREKHDDDASIGIANRMHKIILKGGVPTQDGLFASPPPPKPKPEISPLSRKPNRKFIERVAKEYEFDRAKAETFFLKEFREAVSPGDVQRIYERLYTEAVEKGNHHHMKLLLEYLMGKPVETVQTRHVNVNQLIDQLVDHASTAAEDDDQEFDFTIDDEVPVYGVVIEDDE